MDQSLRDLILELHAIEAVKFGDFKMKCGLHSPVYFDLRVIVSYPKIMKTVSDVLWGVREPDSLVDLLCGVPYTALPFATLISCDRDIPMLIRRREAKDHGTKKMIEGKFENGQSCLIVEDVVTSGTSVLETALLLRDHGLVVTDAVVLLNRLQGGTENLARNGIRLRSVCGVNQFVHVLKEEGRIDEATEAGVLDYIKNNQADVLGEGPKKTLPWKMDFGKRLELTRQSIAGRILECILAKKSNLCVAVDVRSSGELLSLAKKLAPHVCCIKTHVDAVDDWSKESAAALVKIASEGNFLLFEDRKFADIGHTVALQYSKVAEWADFVTAHGLPGKGLIDGLEFVANKKDDGKLRGAVILAEMSSAGNLFTPDYIKKCMELCDFSPFVFGYVAQSRLSDGAGLIQFTPGVNMAVSGDPLGQQYVSPEAAVLERGADVVIVGRGIVASVDVTSSAEAYRKAAWDAYEKRCTL